MYVCMYVFMLVCMYAVCTCVFVFVFVCVCVYTYIRATYMYNDYRNQQQRMARKVRLQ